MNERIDVSNLEDLELPELPAGWSYNYLATEPSNGAKHQAIVVERLDGLTVRLLASGWHERFALRVEELLGRRPYVLQLRGGVRLLRSLTLAAAALEADALCPMAPLWAQARAEGEIVDPKTGELRFADRGAE
jgi:hypothetical protein